MGVFAYSQRQASAILRPCEEDIAHATQAQYLISMSREPLYICYFMFLKTIKNVGWFMLILFIVEHV